MTDMNILDLFLKASLLVKLIMLILIVWDDLFYVFFYCGFYVFGFYYVD